MLVHTSCGAGDPGAVPRVRQDHQGQGQGHPAIRRAHHHTSQGRQPARPPSGEALAAQNRRTARSSTLCSRLRVPQPASACSIRASQHRQDTVELCAACTCTRRLRWSPCTAFSTAAQTQWSSSCLPAARRMPVCSAPYQNMSVSGTSAQWQRAGPARRQGSPQADAAQGTLPYTLSLLLCPVAGPRVRV